MASERMLDFMLALPQSVYAFNQKVHDRLLLYTCPSSHPDESPYSVVCAQAYTSRGIPSYLVSFCCPLQSHPSRTEIFTLEIRKDWWGKLHPDDWLSLVVDAAQRCRSFEYP